MMKFNTGVEARFYRLFPSLQPPDNLAENPAPESSIEAGMFSEPVVVVLW